MPAWNTLHDFLSILSEIPTIAAKAAMAAMAAYLNLSKLPTNQPAMNSIYSIQDEFKNARGLTKVQAIHNPNYIHHGTKSYVRLLLKYNFESTKPGPYICVDHLDSSGPVTSNLEYVYSHGCGNKERVLVKKSGPETGAEYGRVTAEDIQNDSLYLCKISIGTPPQSLMVDFDTGSADTWVYSQALSASQVEGHNIFDSDKSSTYKPMPSKSFNIEYGDGSSASGGCGADTILIGGLSVENQTIETAKNLSTQFLTNNTGDGILGLAFSKINTVMDNGVDDPQATPLENMIKQGDIPAEAKLFTSALYSWRDGSPSTKSFYTFGFIDQDLVKKSGEEIHWVKVDNSEGFWAFTSASVSIDGELFDTDADIAIADTGTTLTLLSDEIVDALYAKIPGATYDWDNQGYIFPVKGEVDDRPEFKIDVGGKDFLIRKDDLAVALTDDKEYWYGGVQSRGTLSYNIYGDTFLKSVYAIWDQGNNRFGVVPKLEKPQVTKPPPQIDNGGDKTKFIISSVALAAAD